jgi:hypothetical protein
MTDKRFTNSQSPRASRDSTQDPLEYARGTVPKDWAPEPRRNALGEGNEGAAEPFDKSGNVKQDRGGDTFRSV